MRAGTFRRVLVTAGAMAASILPAVTARASSTWFGEVNLRLTVRDPNGKPVPRFEAMLHTHQEGYIRWQAGEDGDIHFRSGGVQTLRLRDDPHIQVIVRAPDLAPAILRLEYARPMQETVTLTPGRLVDLFVRTADGRSIPREITPLVIYRDFVSRVRIYRMPENQGPGRDIDFEMSKVERVTEGHYQFRVPVKTPPFLIAIDAPGFMRSIETRYFDESDLSASKIEWEIPAAAKLHFLSEAAPGVDLAAYEASWVSVAWRIPEEGKFITLWLQRQKGSPFFDTALNDLPPGRYRAVVRCGPAQSQKAAQRGYSENILFSLAAGEEKTLKVTYSPLDPNSWRGRTTVEAVIREYNGRPAAGKSFCLSYVVPHDGATTVLEGVLDSEGRFRLENAGSGPAGPEFFLRVGENWTRWIRITEPGRQRFEFTLGPEVNDVAPDVTFLDVQDNHSVSLRSLRGRVVYLEFWATWCGPCQIPMMQLDEMMRKRPEDWDGRVEVLAVSIDESPEVAKWYTGLQGWSHIHHVWAGTEDEKAFAGPAGEAFGLNAVPTALLIDPEGRIVWKGHPRDANARTRIDELCRSTDTRTRSDSTLRQSDATQAVRDKEQP